MSEPTILREALLDHQVLRQLPGLLSHLNGHKPAAATPAATRFLDDLREHADAAPRPDPDPTTATSIQEDPVPHTPTNDQRLATNTDTGGHDIQRQQVEAEADHVRGRALLEEAQRTEQALRQSGYDSPVTERTRPATPRPPR